MTTDKQIEANRRNAQKSTGPKTDSGRNTSSMNALRHGLTAQNVTFSDEEAVHFEEFRKGIIADLSPQGALEKQLAERAVICWWRLNRVYSMEVEITKEREKSASNPFVSGPSFLGEKPGPGFIYESLIVGALQHLVRYESALERSLQRALHDLQRIQARRRGEAVMAPIAVQVMHSVEAQETPATRIREATVIAGSNNGVAPAME